ncbi:hypothetical protein RHGRI_032635 [Rhododendron griersonianum]|uniref:Uncharacterized protein n=1 Tax=Rhododendron griersonianum TaxID=479676 RepID=A0AAV6IGC9_9ERIC|nr:hypothetical protein RHGRI_032635 [Rhododendron griersonianum]
MKSPSLLLPCAAALTILTLSSAFPSAYPSAYGDDTSPACNPTTGGDDLVPVRREVYDDGRIFDISHRYTPDMPKWCSEDGIGQFLWLPASMKNGSLANNSEMKIPTHTGTHVDAPGHVFDHYFDAGFDVDTLDLGVLNACLAFPPIQHIVGKMKILLILLVFAEVLAIARVSLSLTPINDAYPSGYGDDSGACSGTEETLVPVRREVYDNGRFFDITHRISSEALFDGSEEVGEFLWLSKSMKNGSDYNFSIMKLPVHSGTHVDAPGHMFEHYFDVGFDVDTLDLDVLNGPALLVDVPRDTNITAEAMKSLNIPKGVRRVLFRTLNTDRRLMWKKNFDTSYVGFMKDGAQWLVDNTDIKLVVLSHLEFNGAHVAVEPCVICYVTVTLASGIVAQSLEISYWRKRCSVVERSLSLPPYWAKDCPFKYELEVTKLPSMMPLSPTMACGLRTSWNLNGFVHDSGGINFRGIDYLSVAAYDDLIPSHLVFLESREIILVEGLKLDDVKLGLYSVHCLPLRLLGAEGSPIRCILIK